MIQSEPRGLGHAVWCARNLIGKEKFAVILPDDIINAKKSVLKQMIELEAKVGGSIISVEKIPIEESKKYGIMKIKKKFDNYFSVKDIVEKPEPKNAPSDLSVIGRYILESEIFTFLNKQKIGVGGEIQLTDGIQYLLKNKNVFGYEFKGKRFDCGSKLGFVKANLGYGLLDNEIKNELKIYLDSI